MAGGSSISIKSSSFADGQRIPTEYTMYGSNTKPDLSWSNVQPDAKSLLLLVHDPDAVQVAGKIWIHWFVYNISPRTTSLEGEYTEGLNSFDKHGYGGPKPPAGSGVHRYIFELYAMTDDVGFDQNTMYSYNQIVDRLKGKVISHASITGLYSKD